MGEARKFWFWNREWHGNWTWAQPPLVPDGWSVHWHEETRRFAFYNPAVEFEWAWTHVTMEAYTWQCPRVVPEPWTGGWDGMEWNEDTKCFGAFVFWNAELQQQMHKVPSFEPPCIGFMWEARRAADGCWEYVHRESGGVSRNWVPTVPEGWQLLWSSWHQAWYWKSLRTGEVSMDLPRLDGGFGVGRSWESLVEQLQEAELLPRDEEVTETVIRKCYRRFALRCHPDKVGNNDEETVTFFSQHKAAFDALDAMVQGVRTAGEANREEGRSSTDITQSSRYS